MKKNFLMCVLLGLVFQLAAQKDQKATFFWVSGTLNFFGQSAITSLETSWQNGSTLHIDEQSSSLSPGFALGWVKKNGWFQEVSLNALAFRKDDNIALVVAQGVDTQTIRGELKKALLLHTRWEIGKFINIKSLPRLNPGIALSLDPFVKYQNVIPYTSTTYPLRYWHFGTELRIIPRLAYDVSDRCSIHLKAALGLSSISWQHARFDNPLLNEIQKTQEAFNLQWGEVPFQGTVGISLKI